MTREAGAAPLCGVYLLTPDWTDTARLLDVTAAALAAGVRALQYRHKDAPPALARAQAERLRELTRAHGALLIVNDDARLARDVGADGVHVGRDDAPIADARALLAAGALVGASCYDQLARAEAAVAAGADYVAFGSVFPSRTKPDAVRAPLELLARARALRTPAGSAPAVVAIGGIDAGNVARVAAAGADAAALITAVYDAPDPHAAAADLVARFNAGRTQHANAIA